MVAHEGEEAHDEDDDEGIGNSRKASRMCWREVGVRVAAAVAAAAVVLPGLLLLLRGLRRRGHAADSPFSL